VSDKAFVTAFQSDLLSTLNPAFQNQVKTALVRNYQMVTQSPQNQIGCPYDGNLQTAYAGNAPDFWGALGAMVYPACNPYGAYVLANDRMTAAVAAAQNEWTTRLTWNNGIYDMRDTNGNVTTPGIFLNAIGQQAITSGFRQLENANDIGQMVGNVFAGLGANLLYSNAGIPGAPAYLGPALTQEQNGLVGQTSAVALQNLYQILSWEQQYNGILSQKVSILVTAVSQVRGAENACWNLIIPKVCADTPSGGTCTSASSTKLTIATSTAFSDAAIAKAGIGVAAESLKGDVDTSNQNITVINSLIVAVQSTDSNARNTALQNLDAIVNANPPVLHTQDSIDKAKQDLATVQALMQGVSGGSAGFIKQTLQNWAGDAIDNNPSSFTYQQLLHSVSEWNGNLPPNGTDTGWCNVNKQATLDQWIAKWTP
jgi:hypothetical protein